MTDFVQVNQAGSFARNRYKGKGTIQKSSLGGVDTFRFSLAKFVLVRIVKFKYLLSYTNQTNSLKIMISNLKTHLKVIYDIL